MRRWELLPDKFRRGYDDGDKTGGVDDGTDGAVGGDDIRGVQFTGCCKHGVGVCDDGDKAGGSDDGTVGPFATMGTKSGDRMMTQLDL